MPVENKGFGALFAEKKDALDHFQASMTSVLPSFPGLPVAKYFDVAVGVDFHETIMPPSPLTPVPHIGMIFDVMGALMSVLADVAPPPPPPPAEGEEEPPVTLGSIATAVIHTMKPTVQVHGMWVANAGAGIQHLPSIVVHTGPVVKPMATSEMWMGSSTVLVDGGPCSTQFHPALSCNLVGFPSLFRANKPPKPKVSLMAPTSILTTVIPGGPPVLVGGPPTIDLFQLMFKLALKGLGKLWKKAKSKFKAPDTKNPKLGHAQPNSKCNSVSEPVDVATGKVFHNNVDFELPGPIPLVWERIYFSNAEVNGPLGYNWHHSYNMGLYDMGNNFFTIRLADGRETAMPALIMGEVFYNRQEQLFWQKDTEGYLLTDANKLMYRFKGPKNLEGYYTLSSIQNKSGFSIQFIYNQRGFLKQLIDSSHRKINVESDELGHILRIYTYNSGEEINLIRYGYDASGNMVQTTDSLDVSKHFYYEGHLLVRLTNQSGFNFYWEYEGCGNNAHCIHTWGDGGVLEYWLQFEEGKTTTLNSLGHSTEYYYDNKKLIHKIIDANGGITHQVYNEYDELVVVTNPEGFSVKYLYNDWGKITKYINENGEAIKYNYDAQMNLTTVTSPEGRRVHCQFDDMGRIVKKTVTGAGSLFYFYEGPLLTGLADSNKRKFNFEYDDQFNLIKLLNPGGSYQTWMYDDLGRMIETTDVEGNTTRRSYDNAGNVIRLLESDGSEHHFVYNSSGNLIDAKDHRRHLEFKYGPLGVITQRVQNGSALTFVYDTELQLRSIANEGGEIYRFGLDALGQVTNEWGFDGLHRQAIRDGCGRIKKVIRPEGRWSSYEYDGVGKTVKEEHSDGSTAAYRYNSDGVLIEALNQDSHIIFKRDEAGRVVKEQQGLYEVTKKYDSLGNCCFTGSSLGAAIEIQYSEDGFLEKIQASMGKDLWTSEWQYNSNSLELQRSFSGGVTVKTEKDRLGRVLRHTIGARGVEQTRTRYVWGEGYRLLRVINELSRAHVNYEYDASDHLLSAEYRQEGSIETIYRIPDKIGNLYKSPNRKDRMYGRGGQLKECPIYYYHYDGEGNLVFKEFKRNENLLAKDKKECLKEKGIKSSGSETGWLYEWGDNGLLKQVTSPNDKITCFYYDPFGRRIAKVHQNKVTRWVWADNVPLHEWSYEGNFPPQIVVSENGTMQREQEPIENLITWIFEEDGFAPCGKLMGDNKYSIITDYLGTPTHAFDMAGNKVWERQLDIYGKARKLIGDKFFCPYLYQGQYEDVETDLIYNRFRYYDKDLGQYISQDPIGLSGGNNLYGYVQNSNTWVDIFGLSGMRGASSTVSAGDASSSLPSKTPVHSEVRNLNHLQETNALKGQDVVITDVVGDLPGGAKPVPVCAECRAGMFDPLIGGGAKSVTIPVTRGGKLIDTITIPRSNFAAARAELLAIVKKFEGTKCYLSRSNEAWAVLEKYRAPNH